MYKAFSTYQIYNMIPEYYNQNSKNLILEPFCCIIKLILLQYKDPGTKISVANNSILFNQPSIGQGFLRTINGDCREDLHNLYHPLLKCVEWYPIQEYSIFYSECKKGLELLKSVYDDNTTIHHTLSHYISIVDGTNKQSLPDTNPIIDTLKDIWNKEEIKAIQELLALILNDKDKDIYIQSLDNIIIAKEKIVNRYIHKISTTY